jgi:hypothetical protein
MAWLEARISTLVKWLLKIKVEFVKQKVDK